MTDPSASHSGLVDIRGVTWRWYTLSPETHPSLEHDGDAICVAFRTPVDPGRELRCVVRDPDVLPPSEEQLRRLFERARVVEL